MYMDLHNINRLLQGRQFSCKACRLSCCRLWSRLLPWWSLLVFSLDWWFVCFAFASSLRIVTRLDWVHSIRGCHCLGYRSERTISLHGGGLIRHWTCANWNRTVFKAWMFLILFVNSVYDTRSGFSMNKNKLLVEHKLSPSHQHWLHQVWRKMFIPTTWWYCCGKLFLIIIVLSPMMVWVGYSVKVLWCNWTLFCVLAGEIANYIIYFWLLLCCDWCYCHWARCFEAHMFICYYGSWFYRTKVGTRGSPGPWCCGTITWV